MSNLIIPGQTRQQRREAARKALSGEQPQEIDLTQLIANFEQAINFTNWRIDVAFESMRLMGATDEVFNQAEANVKARMQILANQAQQVPEVPDEKL